MRLDLACLRVDARDRALDSVAREDELRTGGVVEQVGVLTARRDLADHLIEGGGSGADVDEEDRTVRRSHVQAAKVRGYGKPVRGRRQRDGKQVLGRRLHGVEHVDALIGPVGCVQPVAGLVDLDHVEVAGRAGDRRHDRIRDLDL
jgi:hypothetical protein